MRRPRVRLDGGFLLLLALLLLTEERLAGPFLVSCAVHEAGHLAVLYALGGRVDGLRLTAGGAVMEIGAAARLSYPAEALAVLAGPLTGLGLALLAARLGFYVTAGVSLVLTVFNLLPLRRQDGGRLLRLLLAWRWGPDPARTVGAAASWAVSLTLALLGAWALIRGRGVALLLAGAWILACQFPARGIK